MPLDISSEPQRQITLGTTKLTILGTAHVSKTSADAVAALIASQEFDAIALELCPGRLQALKNPDAFAQLDLFQVLKQGKAGMVAAKLALGSFQQRVAEEAGIEPGAEMRRGLQLAQEYNLPVMAIDRDLGITLKRVYKSVPWWQRAGLLLGLMGSLFSKEKVAPEEIEKLKQGDVLEATFAEFAEESKLLHDCLIAERDAYMALRLQQEALQLDALQQKNNSQPYKNILVVIGAGHLQGLTANLEKLNATQTAPDAAEISQRLEDLNSLPAPKKWLKLIPWLIVAVILAGFALGFSQDTGLGAQMVIDWILINGGLSALGVLLAAAHPLTLVTAFVAAPFTSLNPTIGAGMVAAAAEIYLRKPKVEDFSALRHDTAKLSGWWRNRVARTLLVFIFASLGSAVGTYVGGFHIFGQLAG